MVSGFDRRPPKTYRPRDDLRHKIQQGHFRSRRDESHNRENDSTGSRRPASSKLFKSYSNLTRSNDRTLFKRKRSEEEYPYYRYREIDQYEGKSNSRERRSALERVSGRQNLPPPPSTRDENPGDYRDLLPPISASADPTGSSVRKERAKRGEASGEFEKAAAHLVEAAIAHTQALSHLNERNFVSPHQSSAERIPTRLRLGHVEEQGLEDDEDIPLATLMKRNKRKKDSKRVDPRSAYSNPKPLAGPCVRKRQTKLLKPSPRRKVIATKRDISRNKDRERGLEQNLGIFPQRVNSQSQSMYPLPRIIPAAPRKKMDFQNPSGPAP